MNFYTKIITKKKKKITAKKPTLIKIKKSMKILTLIKDMNFYPLNSKTHSKIANILKKMNTIYNQEITLKDGLMLPAN